MTTATYFEPIRATLRYGTRGEPKVREYRPSEREQLAHMRRIVADLRADREARGVPPEGLRPFDGLASLRRR